MPVAEMPEALRSEDVKEKEYVDEDAYYYVDLQFGSRASWRNMQGRARPVVPQGGNKLNHVHDPKVYRHCGPYDGNTVNGLISGHNDWVKIHRLRKDSDYRGQVDRQLLVLNVEPTDDLPANLSKTGAIPVSMLKSFIDEQIKAAIGGA